ncbi:MAG TPA: TlpA disulfide reductase family protein [Dokdonella sp.]
MKLPACLALVLAALAIVPAALAAPEGMKRTAERPALVIDTLDGGRFDLASQRGKWVIVNFWATWCSPCIEEMPALSKFVASREDVVAIGLAWEDTERAEVVEFAKKHPVEYPLAQPDVYEPLADFETPRGLPTTYLIAPDGRVAKKFTGPVTMKDLENAIAAAAAAK